MKASLVRLAAVCAVLVVHSCLFVGCKSSEQSIEDFNLQLAAQVQTLQDLGVEGTAVVVLRSDKIGSLSHVLEGPLEAFAVIIVEMEPDE